MLSVLHARILPSIKQLSHSSLLFPRTLSTILEPIALRNRRLSFAGSMQYFGSESPKQGSKTVFHPGADGIFQHGFRSKVAVVGFLNAVLGFEGRNAITKVEYLSVICSPENILSHGDHFDPVALTCYNCD